MALIAEIMDAPEFAEIMFLVGFILFLIEVVRLIASRRRRWRVGLPLASRRRRSGVPGSRLACATD